MKLNEKWTLFLIATFTTFFGITDNLLKGTEAKPNESVDNIVAVNLDDFGLNDITLSSGEIQFDPNVFMYNVKVNDLENLIVTPVLTNDNVKYTMDIIGDNSLIVIITIDLELTDRKIYTLYIEEI